MAGACIWYLEKASMDLEKIACSPRNMSAEGMEAFAGTIQDYPLLAYALEHTASHLSRSQKPHLDAMQRLAKCMEQSPIRFFLSEWMRRQAADLGIEAPPMPEENGQAITEKNCQAFRNGVLHCAASQVLSTAVKIALVAGADAESQSKLHKSRENAMCLAIRSSRGKLPAEVEEVVRVLLQHGAKANSRTRFRGTPLHYAGKYMQTGVVALLLSHHASVHDRDAQDMTPLHRTIIGLNKRKPTLADDPADEQYVEGPQTPQPGVVLSKPDPPPKEPERLRPNGTLPRDVSLDCVELLLQANADPKAADKQGQKPIHWAAALRDREDIVKALLYALPAKQRKRAANERCANTDSTPLHWASGYGNLNVVKFLLQEGARPGDADNRGRTAISWAARYGHHEILEALLDRVHMADSQGLEAVVNKQETPVGRRGRHALIWACQKGHQECARLLIKANANVNLAEGGGDDVGGTALSWAITFGHQSIVELLLKKGANLDQGNGKRPLLGWAAATGNVNMYKRLLRGLHDSGLHVDHNEADPRRRTPFMLAAARGHVGMLEYLHKTHKVWTNSWDNDGNTSLLLAAGWGQLNAVEWLAGLPGMDINRANNNWDTALHRAAYWGRKDVVNYLERRRGANLGLENQQGKTYKALEEEYNLLNKRRILGEANAGKLSREEEEEEDDDEDEDEDD